MSGMSSKSSTSRKDFFKEPLKSIGYIAIVFLGVLFNLFLMVISFLLSQPSQNNAYGNDWFFASILFLVPLFGSFLFCVLASLKMPRRIVIAPIYVIVFSIVPTLILGSYVIHSLDFNYSSVFRMNSIYNYLFITILLYLFWGYTGGIFFQPIVRGLVGAFAERDNIKSGTKFYKISHIKNVFERFEDNKWLSDLCSMRIIEKKEEKDEIRLKLNKHRTDFFLTICAKRVDSKNLVSLTPYELIENPAQKVISVSDDSKYSLSPQMEEIKKALNLEQISSEEPEILYDSINYTMSPARFPMLLKFRNQILVMFVTLLLSGLTVLTYFTEIFSIETVIGIIAIIVALGSTAFNIVGKK